jgi:hypothetical protein
LQRKKELGEVKQENNKLKNKLEQLKLEQECDKKMSEDE